MIIVWKQQVINGNISVFEANMLLSLCFPPSVEHGGEWRLKPALKKCKCLFNACELTLDPNTAHRHLSLSEDHRKVMRVEEDQSYPDHPERFDSLPQVLCREGLAGRCYWEVERRGGVGIGVTYRRITRRGEGDDSMLGGNNKSWSLYCHDDGYTACYNDSETVIPLPPSGSTRVGVYVDRPAGSLSFYRVSPGVGGSSDTLTHIHTFWTTFTQEDLLPGFRLWRSGSSVSLFFKQIKCMCAITKYGHWVVVFLMSSSEQNYELRTLLPWKLKIVELSFIDQ
ncbi:Stonustoxin subunit beta [Merluccius polli]|uniref:Stonustoxin subunit beta n=1 Tax=Merluccius polli TaxID=89951 RepID=A0AA47MFN5_MERPO|nr:Stonustoxin subunit beta [Merluccius polli]